MADYVITFARPARKEWDRLSDPIATRVLAHIESLAAEPRPRGCRKLEGADDLWRIRVGDYRVIYSVNDRNRIVDIVSVRHRSDAYR